MSRIQQLVILLILISLSAGCSKKSTLKTDYGKLTSNSINGTRVLADMFEAKGLDVKRRTRISPRINRYNTIVWFPDDFSCPSDKAVTALNQWLSDGHDRTLIYVGRDYTAQTDYLTQVKDSAPIDQKEELLRQVAEGKFDQDNKKVENIFSWLDEDTDTCEWFKKQTVQRRKGEKFKRKSSDLGDSRPDIELSTILKPIKGDTWRPEKWLTVDREPFVTKMKTDNGSDSQIFIVSNGSLLLNFSLVNANNRALATELIDECDPRGNAVFLESGASGVEVSDSDNSNHNYWSWVAQPPLRYIVPHFLFWGILFCFVYFPIFGRPRRVKQKSTSTFRSHINAMGKLFSKSDHQNVAIDKIRNYQKQVSGESKRKPDNK